MNLESLEDRRLLSFQPAGNYDAGPYPYAVAVGDLNGDGIPDLVVTNDDFHLNALSSVSVLLGNGDGSFQPPQTFATKLNSTSVAIGDFNGDGIPDLAVVNEGNQFGQGSGVSVLLGNGDGTFADAVDYAVGVTPCSVAVGDFNGDGILDLAVANYATNDVSVLLGNGDGSFQPAVNYPAGRGPETVAVGDFNNDGVADIAVTDYGFMNLDRGGVSILQGNGDGSFQPPVSYAAGSHPLSLAVGDFTGDGQEDLAVVTDPPGPGGGPGRSIRVLLGNGDGTFQTPNQAAAVGPSLWSVAVADFNSDGYQDLVVTDLLVHQISVFLGNGDGSFQPAQQYTAGNYPAGVAVGDFNGDGLPDVVAANNLSNDVSVFLNDGDWAGAPRGLKSHENRRLQNAGESVGSLPLGEVLHWQTDGSADFRAPTAAGQVAGTEGRSGKIPDAMRPALLDSQTVPVPQDLAAIGWDAGSSPVGIVRAAPPFMPEEAWTDDLVRWFPWV